MHTYNNTSCAKLTPERMDVQVQARHRHIDLKWFLCSLGKVAVFADESRSQEGNAFQAPLFPGPYINEKVKFGLS